MQSFNKLNLDVKKTVETTLERAKGWLKSSYPSDVRQDSKLKIDVRYLGERIPFAPLETINEKQFKNKKIDYSKKPVFIQMQRGKTNVVLQRYLFIDKDKNEKTSYSIFIQARDGNMYRCIETENGEIIDSGNHLLALAVQQDKDFGALICFVKKGEKVAKTTPKWNLNQKMIEARKTR